jgi:hypothetical protein
MSENQQYLEEVKCECGETASLDLQFIPPIPEHGKLPVHYVCAKGHKFVRKYDFKG